MSLGPIFSLEVENGRGDPSSEDDSANCLAVSVRLCEFA